MSPGVQMPPDIVRLKSGGFVRGVILELDPAARTVIQTDTARREIAASDIVYAGPAARDPLAAPVAPPLTPTSPPVAPLRLALEVPLIELRSTSPSVQFFLWTGSGTFKGAGSDDFSPRTWSTSGTAQTFRPLCTAPCSVPLAEGYYRMGLARRGERPVLLEGNVEVRRGVPLQAEYTVDTRSRAPAAGLLAGSAVVLLTGMFFGYRATQSDQSGDLLVPLLLGTVGVGGVIAGALLMQREPDTVRIRPVLPGAASARQAMAPRSAEAPRMAGPTFAGSF